jgi:hypothetical protein
VMTDANAPCMDPTLSDPRRSGKTVFPAAAEE